jgi:hypothetical protein
LGGGGLSRPFLFERGIMGMWTLGWPVLVDVIQLVVKVVYDVFEVHDLLFKIVALSLCHGLSTGGYLHVPAFHSIKVALLLLKLVLVHMEGILFANATAATVHHYT